TRKVALLLNAEPPRTSLPPGSKALIATLPAEYQWQLELENICKQARPLGPVFVSVIAETGAGKTLASSRALSGLSGNSIRATFALGLRSITWQLGKSMMNDAEFPVKDVMVAVGQPETLGLDELAKELLDKEQLDGALTEGEIFGSESSAGTAIAADAMPSEPLDHKWVEVLCSQKQALNLFGEKALDMLTTPLLACTADHLVASVSLLNGGDAKMFLRLASSDLVLDEIDAYSANDLQSIAKLAFTAGMFQKNVVLLSATMSPPVQQGVYLAWKQGVEVGCAINAKPLSFASIFSSNTVAPRLLHNPSDAEAKSQWTGYVGDVCAKYAHRAETCPLRRLQTYKMQSKTLKEGHAELVSIAKRLHKDNSTKDPASNSDVSIGFIRCNTASGAWKLSKFLADYQDPDGYVVKFVCYHAKYPRDYLGVLDATLGEITNRKNDKDFLQNGYLRRVLDNNENKQVLIIVCTTSLIETGRDFDFDWAILEPKGVRSEVQAGGRVRRHRRKFGVPHPNMVILEEPLSNIEDPGKNLWGRPGIENQLPKLKLTYALPSVFGAPAIANPSKRVDPRVAKLGQRPILTACDALPVKAWKIAFDAQLCLLPALLYEDNRIGYCEQTVQGLNLLPTRTWNEDSGLPPSVGFYLSTFAPLNAVHAVRTKFRGDNESTLVFIPGNHKVTYWDSVARLQKSATNISMLESPSGNALVPNIEDVAATLPGSSVHIRGCSLSCRQGLGATKEARWDPLLGFNESTNT
ncbi:hypothetical protein LC612_35850, partial [Nostoc sp. CHAB 5834]|nr:hypothetical protein [Nostoc sp. CHAB 5834]